MCLSCSASALSRSAVLTSQPLMAPTKPPDCTKQTFIACAPLVMGDSNRDADFLPRGRDCFLRRRAVIGTACNLDADPRAIGKLAAGVQLQHGFRSEEHTSEL